MMMKSSYIYHPQASRPTLSLPRTWCLNATILGVNRGFGLFGARILGRYRRWCALVVTLVKKKKKGILA
jgi:hypothetical protein